MHCLMGQKLPENWLVIGIFDQLLCLGFKFGILEKNYQKYLTSLNK